MRSGTLKTLLVPFELFWPLWVLCMLTGNFSINLLNKFYPKIVMFWLGCTSSLDQSGGSLTPQQQNPHFFSLLEFPSAVGCGFRAPVFRFFVRLARLMFVLLLVP